VNDPYDDLIEDFCRKELILAKGRNVRFNEYAGVYALYGYYSKDLVLDIPSYIGLSTDLERRLSGHDESYTHFRALILWCGSLYELEWRLAYKLKPWRGWHVGRPEGILPYCPLKLL
jgi:hypothetical protein